MFRIGSMLNNDDGPPIIVVREAPRKNQGTLERSSHLEGTEAAREAHFRYRESQLRRAGTAIGKMPFALTVDEAEELRNVTRKFLLTSQCSRVAEEDYSSSYLKCSFVQGGGCRQ